MAKTTNKQLDGLSAEARSLYDKVRKQWTVRDQPGLTVLLVAMQAWDEMQTYRKVLAKEGGVIKDRFGQPKIHPATQLLKESRAHFLASVKALNLDLESLEWDE